MNRSPRAPHFHPGFSTHFPGRTLGLWMDPDARIPWEPTGPLDPTDHTLIVGQFMQYPLQVFRAVGVTAGQAPDLSALSRSQDVELQA